MDIGPAPSSANSSKLVIGASCPFPAMPPPVAIGLTVLPAHPCSYLPDRMAQSRAFLCDAIDGHIYHEFMDAGFRRSGKLIYQPICAGCRKCLPIRVPVARFAASKSQRRCVRRNQDLTLSLGKPCPADERFELYRRYVHEWHQGDTDKRQAFEDFLYDSPAQTIEFSYRDPQGKLVAAGICDVCAVSLSSVYFYFDPDEAWRGLGTYGAIQEIAFAQRARIAYYYLGYWVDGCGAMEYKSSFRPFELLYPDGIWREKGGDGWGP